MITSRNRYRSSILFLVVINCVGCGNGAVQRGDLAGTLKLNGVPVKEATILLVPTPPNSTREDTVCKYSASVENGQFSITKKHGPISGQYDIVVQPIEPDSDEVFAEMKAKKPELLKERNRFRAAIARQTPSRLLLSANESNSISIELTDK